MSGTMAVRGGQTIAKAIDLLRTVSQSEIGSTFTDLQVASGQPKATLHRLIQSMTDERLIRLDPDDRRYRLGYGLLEMAGLAWSRLDVRQAAREVLSELSRESGEGVDLAILDGIDVLYVDKIEGAHRRYNESAVGTRRPAYCTAAGKALLAYRDADQAAALDRMVFHRLTARTPGTRADLMVQLQQVRRNGFAVESEEQEMGTLSIAAPIFDQRNRPVASISVTAPTFRSDERRTIALAKMTLAAANQATLNCGGRPIGIVEPLMSPMATEIESPSWLPEGDVPC